MKKHRRSLTLNSSVQIKGCGKNEQLITYSFGYSSPATAVHLWRCTGERLLQRTFVCQLTFPHSKVLRSA